MQLLPSTWRPYSSRPPGCYKGEAAMYTIVHGSSWRFAQACFSTAPERLRLTFRSLSRSLLTVISSPRRLMGSKLPTIGATSFAPTIRPTSTVRMGRRQERWRYPLVLCVCLWPFPFVFVSLAQCCLRARETPRIFSIPDISFAFHSCVSYDMYVVCISFFNMFTIHTY